MSDFILLAIALFFAAIIGAGIVFFLVSSLKRGRKGGGVDKITLRMLTERVRSVGKLVGLEVHAKEIATATSGWNWLPPILLSQAKVAMIFQFEKQYAVELGAINESDVVDLGNGRFRVTLPPIVGSLRLMDVEPYDIQQGRVLGLVDVINMNAERQSQLMRTAQTQAAELFEKNDDRYEKQARDAVERQLHSIAKLFDGSLDIRWHEQAVREQPRIIMDEALKTGPAFAGN
ncbi:MAG: DUF4230 domain-containing protein [Phycisphaerales bacterium]|nr:DUF4230 domain-containing protein [Phycisphaerales bacterium]